MLSHLRRPSSSIQYTSSALCYVMLASGTPCSRSSFSCSSLPPESFSTTYRGTHHGGYIIPLEQILRNPNATDHVAGWNIELQPFNLRFDTTRVIKGRALADFVAEWTDPMPEEPRVGGLPPGRGITW